MIQFAGLKQRAPHGRAANGWKAAGAENKAIGLPGPDEDGLTLWEGKQECLSRHEK